MYVYVYIVYISTVGVALVATVQVHSHYTQAVVSACGRSDLCQTLAQKLQIAKTAARVCQMAATQDL